MAFFDDALFAATFGVFGVPALLTKGAATHAITVIDKTAGVELSDLNTEMTTVRPVAEVRGSEIAALGLTVADLRLAGLKVNNRAYRVEAVMPRPSFNGEADGRLWLVLMGV